MAEPTRTEPATVIKFLRDLLAELEETNGTITSFTFHDWKSSNKRSFSVEWKVDKETGLAIQ